MIPNPINRRLLFFLVCFFTVPLVRAQIFVREYLNLSPGFPHTDLVTVQDDRFADLTTGTGIDFRDKVSYALVTLGLDPDLNLCHAQPLRYRVTVQSVETLIATPGSPAVQTNYYTLEVNYDPALQRTETENAYIQVPNGRKLKLSVVQVEEVDDNNVATPVSTPSLLPGDLYLEGEIYRERYENFNPALGTSIPTLTAPTGTELTFYQDDHVFLAKWQNVAGAAEYELEWTYADNYGSTGYTSTKPTSQIPVRFKNNSSRVRVKRSADNRYFIPKIYAQGYVVFRVRAVGKGGPDLEDDIFGKWSLDNADAGTTLNLVPSNMYFVSANQNSTIAGQTFNNLNAQYTVSFSEDGKILASGTYADGTSRVRQNTSAIKVNDGEVYGKMSMITETIYDHMGRAAISTLPAVTKRGLWYTPNYNKNAAGNKYSYKDFDTDAHMTGTCVAEADPMNTVSGSAQYYSSANPYKTDQQALVPDAFGYPFTHNVFERDNTKRPKLSTGLGVYHKMGSGHEVKYIYGGADQLQLNRLFGTDAGYASYYKKTMVIDPNGQIGITYMDMAGRTVATALAGDVPHNLYALTDSLGDTLATSGVTVTEDLLNKSVNHPNGSYNPLSNDGRSYTLSYSMLVTSEQEYLFSYSMELAALADSCFPDLCMDCVYDLELSLRDECGNYLIGNAGLDGPLFTQIGGQTLDTLCNDTTGYAAWSPAVGVTLKPGQYMLYKKLSVNENALDFYLDKMMRGSICLLEPDHFYQLPDIGGCEISCEECLANIGTWQDFYDDHKGEFGGDDSLAAVVLTQAYNALKADCEDLCTDRSRDLCANAYELMLQDFSPGGQYAQYDDDGNGNIDASPYPVSIYNTANLLPRKLAAQFTVPPASAPAIAGINNQVPDWRRPVYYDPSNTAQPYQIGYFDESGTRVKVYVEIDGTDAFSPAVVNNALVYPVNPANNEYYTYPENLLDPSDFVNGFRPSYAKSLVIYHPEFFQYEWCAANYGYTKTFTVGTGTVTVNTFDFDQQLSDMNALQAAALFPASNASQLFTAVTALDPFFASNPQATANYISGISALGIMQGKWNLFQAFPVSPFVMNLVQAAYATNHCGYDPACSMPSGIWTPGGLLSSDNDWKTFVDFYTSSKQNAMTLTQNLYAYYGSPASPTPWKHVSAQCIGSGSYVPITEFLAFISSGGTVLYRENPCNPVSFVHYRQKVRRFGLSATQISDHYGLSDPPSADELRQYADQGYYQATGKCPMVRDLEILINQLASAGTLKTSYTDLLQGPYLGSSLYGYLGGAANTSIGYGGTVSGNTLTADISAANTCTSPFVLTLPPEAVTLGYTFEDIVMAFNVGNISHAGGNYGFQVRAVVFNTSVSAQTDTFLLQGTTCLELTGCEASFQSVCKPTPEAKDLMNLMSALSQANILFNTAAANINAYNALLTPKLQFYLGAAGNYTWQYDPAGVRFILTNTATAQAVRLDVTTLGLNPAKQYQFTSVSGPATTTPSPGTGSQFILKATEIVPGSYNPIPGQTFGAPTATMEGGVQMVNFGQGFPVTLCEPVKPIECNTTEHHNLDNLQDLFGLWISMQPVPPMPGYVPQEYTDSCLTGLALAGGQPFSIASIAQVISITADMAHSQNTINSHYFTAVVLLTDGTTDTLTGYYCQPMRNCDTCEAEACKDITLNIQFPTGFVPSDGNVYFIEPTSDCIRFKQDQLVYHHTSAQAYWEDYAAMIENANTGITAHAAGGILYITFDPAVYGEKCPCDKTNEYQLRDKKNESVIDTFTSGCCDTGPAPCKDIVLHIPLPDENDLKKYGGFGITRNDEKCIRVTPSFFNLAAGTSYTQYWIDYATAINAQTPGAHAMVVNGELVITFSASVYGQTCPCEKNYVFNLVTKEGTTFSTHTAGCCTTEPAGCRPGDALFDIVFAATPGQGDVFRFSGSLPECAGQEPFSFTYSHTSLSAFLAYVAAQIGSTPGVYATVSGGNTLHLRVSSDALGGCRCSDRLTLQVDRLREGEAVDKTTYTSKCCDTNPVGCEAGDALLDLVFTEIPRREDGFVFDGKIFDCLGIDKVTFVYNHASLSAFLTDVAGQITAGVPGVSAQAAGNTLHIRIPASALRKCKCSDNIELVVSHIRSGQKIGEVTAKTRCCDAESGTKNRPAAGIAVSSRATGKTVKNTRTPGATPKQLQRQEDEEAGPWDPWTELTTPTDCHPEVVPFPPDTNQVNPCIQFLMETALVNAQFAYDEYLAQKREEYKQLYIARCMQTLETFERTYTDGEYHFTLYYYDRAGNLVKTVPPHAVTPLAGSDLAAVNTARDNGTVMVPLHNRASVGGNTPRAFALSTRYRFNTLNAAIEQMTPDAGKVYSFYDRIGRLVLTRDARQAAQSAGGAQKYAYTLFDLLGRVVETGEMTHSTPATRPLLYGTTGISFLNPVNYTSEDVVQTIYDANATPPAGFVQDNLRSRVAYTRKKPKGETAFVFATYYNYDYHGNIKSLLQENKKAPTTGLAFNRLDYTYDIVSGKTLEAAYNTGKPDQYFHQYGYDDQNRLTHTYTGQDRIRYDLDARYFYYRHGPLARTEIGQNKVQGLDYMYTIQGWYKSMNSDALDEQKDPAHDGYDNVSNPNRYFAKDAYGFSLSYFDGDYVPIGTLAYLPSPVLPVGYITGEMWNGNIAAMNSTLKKPVAYTSHPLTQRFRYDQLNRIRSGEAFSDLDLANNTWPAVPNPLQLYATSYTYDPAGNLFNLNRNGDRIDSLEMDSLQYIYYPKTNRLQRVLDPVNAGYYSLDIDGQAAANNYVYDENGHLVKDESEEIASIEWDVYGKVKKVIRTGTSQKPDFEFMYDAFGRRVMKTVIPKNGNPAKTDFYTYDSQGNIISIYTYENDNGNETYRVEEQLMYGLFRLGNRKSTLELLSYIPTLPVIHKTLRGEKRYELNDHLGDVHSVVSDRKKRVCDGGFSHYEADILLTYDYYPFGMPMPGRSFYGPVPCETVTTTENDTLYNEPFDSGTGGFTGSFIRGFTLFNDHGQLFANGTLTAIDILTGQVSHTSGWSISGNYTLASNTGYGLSLDVILDTAHCPNDTVICTVSAGTTVLGTYTVTASGTIHIPFATAMDSTVTVKLVKQNPSACGFLIDNLAMYTQTTQTVTLCDSTGVNHGAGYRFGYNGKEKDDDIKGEGNSLDYGARIYDPRLGRFLTVDPSASEYAFYSPYLYAENKPILCIDKNGMFGDPPIAIVGSIRYGLDGKGFSMNKLTAGIGTAFALKPGEGNSVTFNVNNNTANHKLSFNLYFNVNPSLTPFTQSLGMKLPNTLTDKTEGSLGLSFNFENGLRPIAGQFAYSTEWPKPKTGTLKEAGKLYDGQKENTENTSSVNAFQPEDDSKETLGTTFKGILGKTENRIEADWAKRFNNTLQRMAEQQEAQKQTPATNITIPPTLEALKAAILYGPF